VQKGARKEGKLVTKTGKVASQKRRLPMRAKTQKSGENLPVVKREPNGPFGTNSSLSHPVNFWEEPVAVKKWLEERKEGAQGKLPKVCLRTPMSLRKCPNFGNWEFPNVWEPNLPKPLNNVGPNNGNTTLFGP